MAIVSAQVILRPDAEPAAPAVAEELRRAGFTIGPAIANNFSITGSGELFEKYFRMRPQTTHPGQEIQLPINVLPKKIRRAVHAVVFTKLPDFGPGNY